jgi:hypothetical protein
LQAKNGEEDDVFKAPTTAQRRQMFQDRINSVQETSSGNSVVDSSSSNAVAASPLPKRATRIFGDLNFLSLNSFFSDLLI